MLVDRNALDDAITFAFEPPSVFLQCSDGHSIVSNSDPTTRKRYANNSKEDKAVEFFSWKSVEVHQRRQDTARQ